MCTDILGHPPSLCNCRRVWHPCHTHAPYQGVQWSPLHQPSKNCTNQAATASSHSKRLLCVLCILWDNAQPKHLCASVPSVGGLFRAATRTNKAAIASSHRIHRTHRSLLLKCTPTEFTEFSCRGEFLCILRVPWDNTTHPDHLCASVPSVGGLLSGWRGYGRDAIPS